MHLSALNLPHLTGKVNLAQLAFVQTEHMPPAQVRFASETDLIRVAREVAEAEPELADEAGYVRDTELHRRASKVALTA